MRYQISTYNQLTKVKSVRYIMDDERVKKNQRKLMDEVSQEAYTIVLTEIID